jgi:hypothetical protein
MVTLRNICLLLFVVALMCLKRQQGSSSALISMEGIINDKALVDGVTSSFVHPKPQHLQFIDKPEGDSLDVQAENEPRVPVFNRPDSASSGRSLCDRNQVIAGQWVPEQLEKPPYVTPTVHLRCYPREFYYKKEPWNTWQWQPQSAKDGRCEMASWNVSAFCSLLRGATVSVVGDSLSWEHYSSLIQLNGKSTHQGYQHQSRELHMNIFQSVCRGSTRILYRRDDRLLNLTDSLQTTFPTVLVLNRGAHFVNDTEHMSAIRHNLEEVRRWLDDCRTKYNVAYIRTRTPRVRQFLAAR